MSDSRTIDLPEIGEVLFERSTRAKHVNIAVRPFTGVRVAVPRGVSFSGAERVVLQKTGWIKAKQEEARQVERQHQESSFLSPYISKASAKGIIHIRLEELARKHHISYNRVFIRGQKTRWGSCSSKKNLSLNYKIALLPQKLMDYILLHELLHIKYPNHGRQFWDELSKIVGDAKAIDRELKKYSYLLY